MGREGGGDMNKSPLSLLVDHIPGEHASPTSTCTMRRILIHSIKQSFRKRCGTPTMFRTHLRSVMTGVYRRCFNTGCEVSNTKPPPARKPVGTGKGEGGGGEGMNP